MFLEFDHVAEPGIARSDKFSLDIGEIAGIMPLYLPKKQVLIFFTVGGLVNTHTRVFLKSGKELLFKIPYSELKEIVDGARSDEKLSKS